MANRRKQTQASRGTRRHDFSRIPSVKIPRSVFNRSHDVKTAFDAGWLIPIFVDEALPGDTLTLRMNFFARMATPLKAPMDNMYIDFFFFAVPNRLVWDNWQKFNGEQENPGDSTDYLVPQVVADSDGFERNSIYDYMGIPISNSRDLAINALHFRAANLIYNEWFRSQDLIDSLPVPKDDGPDDPAIYKLFKRNKRHDYATSCLPFPQKGQAVQLPLGQVAPVQSAGTGVPVFSLGGDLRNLVSQAGVDEANWSQSLSSVYPAAWEEPNLEADLTSATAATINQIREAFQLQRMFERDARGGTRYTEIIRSHFGVVSPDQRLQRPEYLGGGSQRIHVNPVAATADFGTSSPTKFGDVSAFVTSAGQGIGFSRSFTEHCVLLGFACVRADLHYQEALNRMWSRRTRYDFYWPSLAHLGEQAVLRKEVHVAGGPQDEETFGYQERYAEYRYKPSLITGTLRSSHPQSLDVWHLAQDFGGVVPVLGQSFIEEDPPINRIVAVPAEPDFLFDAQFQYRCARPMPTYGVPGLIDHF